MAHLLRRPKRRTEYSPFVGTVEVGFFSRLEASLLRFLERPSIALARRFNLDRMIERAGAYIPPPLFALRMVISLVITLVISAIIFAISLTFEGLPLFSRLILFLLGCLLPVFAISIPLMDLKSKADGRKKQIEEELSFASVYLTTLARGGVSPIECLRRLAQMKWFPAFRKEVANILRNVYLLGKDPITAIKENAASHPSRVYRDFLEGYVTTVSTGGDVVNYLEMKTRALFEAKLSNVRIVSERVSLITEIFVILSVLTAIVFYILFAISTMTPGTPFSSLTSQVLFFFVFLPMTSILSLAMLHMTQPKTIVQMYLPQRTLIFSLPMSAAFFFLVTLIFGWNLDSILFSLALALTMLSVPPAVAYVVETQYTTALEGYLASLLRDITEIRKTGLSPEKCIESIAKRDYGPLTRFLRVIATNLTWGVSLKSVIEKVSGKLRDWFAIVILNFLADAIDVGGGSVHVLDTLARFSNTLSDIESELKRSIKPYIAMPYLGAIVLSASTLIILYLIIASIPTMLQTSAQRVPPEELSQIILLFSSSLLINSWLMGLVAGKISTRSIMGGFKHAILLVLISYVSIAVILKTLIAPYLTPT